ncbi:MAG TPA: hypothetical protein ENJ08_05850 [Gammaproteobacteria bacterium]|nr:hypothetical protein [Gammaproteobacteria bacterium]
MPGDTSQVGDTTTGAVNDDGNPDGTVTDDVMDTCIEWKLTLRFQIAELGDACLGEVTKQFWNNRIKEYNRNCGSISGYIKK